MGANFEIKIYAVKDSATCFMQPMFHQSDAQAKREFVDGVRAVKGESLISAHPEDFTLYRIGSYFPETGEIVPERIPVWIADGSAASFKEV